MNKDDRSHDNDDGKLLADDVGSAGVSETKETNWSLIMRLVGAAIVATLFVLFIVQNAESVEVDFLTTSFSLPRSVLILASAALGVLLWELAGVATRRSRKKS